jgi:hypothetical protein
MREKLKFHSFEVDPDNFYFVSVAERPEEIDNLWADNIVSEWYSLYREFMDKGEKLLLKANNENDNIETFMTFREHPKSLLRGFAIGFRKKQ